MPPSRSRPSTPPEAAPAPTSSRMRDFTHSASGPKLAQRRTSSTPSTASAAHPSIRVGSSASWGRKASRKSPRSLTGGLLGGTWLHPISGRGLLPPPDHLLALQAVPPLLGRDGGRRGVALVQPPGHLVHLVCIEHLPAPQVGLDGRLIAQGQHALHPSLGFPELRGPHHRQYREPPGGVLQHPLCLGFRDPRVFRHHQHPYRPHVEDRRYVLQNDPAHEVLWPGRPGRLERGRGRWGLEQQPHRLLHLTRRQDPPPVAGFALEAPLAANRPHPEPEEARPQAPSTAWRSSFRFCASAATTHTPAGPTQSLYSSPRGSGRPGLEHPAR